MTNPLMSPSPLPFGLPPFADITDEHYAEAVEAGLAGHLAEIQAIVDTQESASFENTALAMERSGQLLQRAAASFFTLVSADASDAIRELETTLSPRFSAHQDAVYLNRGLFERFAAINTDRLDAESARLVDEYLKEFRQSGIQLDGAGQERLKAVNAELSRLGTEFGQRVKEAMKSASLLLDDAAELAGLPADDVASAAEAARTAGHEESSCSPSSSPATSPPLPPWTTATSAAACTRPPSAAAATAAASMSWTSSRTWSGSAPRRRRCWASRTTPSSPWTSRRPRILRQCRP